MVTTVIRATMYAVVHFLKIYCVVVVDKCHP